MKTLAFIINPEIEFRIAVVVVLILSSQLEFICLIHFGAK